MCLIKQENKGNEAKIRESCAAADSMEVEAHATNEIKTEDLTAERSNLLGLKGGAASNQLNQNSDRYSVSLNENNDSGNFLG